MLSQNPAVFYLAREIKIILILAKYSWLKETFLELVEISVLILSMLIDNKFIIIITDIHVF